MPLALRIAAGFLLLLAVMFAVVGYHLTLIHRLQRDLERISTSSLTVGSLTLGIEENISRLSDFTEKYLVFRTLEALDLFADPSQPEVETGIGETPDLPSLTDSAPEKENEHYGAELSELRTAITTDLAALERLQALSQAETEAISDFSSQWQAYLRRAELRQRGLSTGEAEGLDSLRERFTLPFEPMVQRLQKVRRTSQRALRRLAQRNAQRGEKAVLIARIAAFAGLLAALLTTFVVGRSVMLPLRRLTKGTRELSKGEFSFRVEPSGSPEFALLAQDFNAMAEKLSELDRLKQELISNVSHDLKAPLASMQETTRLLLDRLPGSLTEKQERLLGMNFRCGERLSTMISNLLDLSRLEGEGAKEEFHPQNLAPLLVAALDDLENLIAERGLTVMPDLPNDPVVVECAGPAILQVLGNILSNAAKFTPRNGSIGVRLRNLRDLEAAEVKALGPGLPSRRGKESLEGALVEIWDSGPGVPNAHKLKIFQRFHRVDPARRGKQGTGLGLAISRNIAESHGGYLWVEDHPQGGSCFRLFLWTRVPTEVLDKISA